MRFFIVIFAISLFSLSALAQQQRIDTGFSNPATEDLDLNGYDIISSGSIRYVSSSDIDLDSPGTEGLVYYDSSTNALAYCDDSSCGNSFGVSTLSALTDTSISAVAYDALSYDGSLWYASTLGEIAMAGTSDELFIGTSSSGTPTSGSAVFGVSITHGGATDTNATVFGNNASYGGSGATPGQVVIGKTARATLAHGIAIGAESDAIGGSDSIALGFLAQADLQGCIAAGSFANCNDTSTLTLNGDTYHLYASGDIMADGSVIGRSPVSALEADMTFALTDEGQFLNFVSSASLNATVPPNSSVAFAVGTELYGSMGGGGTLSVVEGSGVTVNKYPSISFTSASFYLKKVDTDEWNAYGGD